MFLRFIAALFFISAGGIFGIYRSERLKKRAEVCDEIAELFRQSSIMIRYRALNVYELSAELKQLKCCGSLDFVKKLPTSYIQGDDFHVIWCRLISEEEGLPDEEKKLLCDFGNIVGTSDIDGQLKSIMALEESLKLLKDGRSETYSRKGRLYRSMGLLIGVMIGIIVI